MVRWARSSARRLRLPRHQSAKARSQSRTVWRCLQPLMAGQAALGFARTLPRVRAQAQGMRAHSHTPNISCTPANRRGVAAPRCPRSWQWFAAAFRCCSSRAVLQHCCAVLQHVATSLSTHLQLRASRGLAVLRRRILAVRTIAQLRGPRLLFVGQPDPSCLALPAYVYEHRLPGYAPSRASLP